MAEGLFIRVSNAAASTTPSVLLDDCYDATDGPQHGLTRSGALYVPGGGSVDVAYSGDVARSFESGCLRGMIDAGTLTAEFLRGDSAGETIAVVVAHGTAQVAAALGKIVSVKIISSGALNDPATINVEGASAGGVLDGNVAADVAALDGLSDLTLADEAADVAADEVLTITLVSAAAIQRATVQLTFAGADA